MIRVDRNIEAPKVLEEEKKKSNGTYNKKEVLNALKIVFNKKCYICENKNITSYNIEHLRPHKNVDMDLKFGWENLFLACAHCNNIKLDNYENVLDCTKVDIDELIVFRKKGNFSWEESIEILPLQDNIKRNGSVELLKTIQQNTQIKETVELLLKVYNGTTEMKQLECSNIRKVLREEIAKFIDVINEYMESDGVDKIDAKNLLNQHLQSNSPFSAFKRWIIRDNSDNLREFLQVDGIKLTLQQN